MIIIYKGKQLRDDQTLAECSITSGTTVQLVHVLPAVMQIVVFQRETQKMLAIMKVSDTDTITKIKSKIQVAVYLLVLRYIIYTLLNLVRY